MRGGVGAAGVRRLATGVLIAALWSIVPYAPAHALQAAPQEIDAGRATVVHWPQHADLAERAAATLRAPLRLPGLRDAAPPPGTRIYLAPSPATFDSLTGGRAPEWSAGVAIPGQLLAVVPVYPVRAGLERDPFVTLRHEIAHLVLHHELPAPPPRWFDEGYATWVSGGWDQASAWQIRMAFMLGRAPPLDSLTLDWPRGAHQARLAYLLSASAVRYLHELGGERAFTVLLDVWKDEGSFDVALGRVYGMTPGQFERAWGQMVRRRYGWLLAISHVALFWTFAAILLVFLFGIRRRRNREKLARMELEDRMLSVDEELPPIQEEEPVRPAETRPPGVDATRRPE